MTSGDLGQSGLQSAQFGHSGRHKPRDKQLPRKTESSLFGSSQPSKDTGKFICCVLEPVEGERVVDIFTFFCILASPSPVKLF